ncbi:YdcF family protein [Macrococcus animalis]|uniref:YdcF family protein n=1 Tax=Macrococcus animalis TaxID=3395467 RepID=UPI0039BE3852
MKQKRNLNEEDKMKYIHAINAFMFLEPESKKSDLIIIPGSTEKCLAEKAAELYQQGISSKIMISGGENKKITGTEAEYLRDVIIQEFRINANDILIETKATNTLENAIYCKNLCNCLELDINSCTIVCKNYHARRVQMTFEQYFIQEIPLFFHPMQDSRKITKINWHLDTSKRNIILNEIKKIGVYFK